MAQRAGVETYGKLAVPRTLMPTKRNCASAVASRPVNLSRLTSMSLLKITTFLSPVSAVKPVYRIALATPAAPPAV